MLFRTGSVMVLVGAVISLARFPLSMSSSPGAPSLVAALSSVGLVWPFLGECLIAIAAVRALVLRSRQPSQATSVDRIAIERRAGVTLVAVGGALLLTGAVIGFFRSDDFVLRVTGHRALLWSWIVCLGVGAALLIASEIQLRRSA